MKNKKLKTKDTNEKIKKDKKKKVQVKELKKEVEDLDNKWKRALADYQNLEKEVERQKKEWTQFSTSQLILRLLPILESLEKASQHLKDRGLELTVGELKKVLEEEGLTPIEIWPGSQFDANLMECIEVQKGEEGKVLKVLEKGYKLKGRVLKIVRVAVGKSKIEKEKETQAKEQLQKGDYM